MVSFPACAERSGRRDSRCWRSSSGLSSGASSSGRFSSLVPVVRADLPVARLSVVSTVFDVCVVFDVSAEPLFLCPFCTCSSSPSGADTVMPSGTAWFASSDDTLVCEISSPSASSPFPTARSIAFGPEENLTFRTCIAGTNSAS